MAPYLEEEDLEIIKEFVDESLEVIDEVEPLLITLEEEFNGDSTVDEETINKIFRMFHSMKGSAGFLGLNVINEVTHHAETLLDLIRKNKIQLQREHVTLFLELCDFLRELLPHIKEKFTDADFEEEARDYIQNLNEFISSEQPGSTTTTEDSKGNGQGKKKEIVIDLGEGDPGVDQSTTPEKETTETESNGDQLISEDMVRQYIVEATDYLNELEESFLALEKEPDNQEWLNKAFRSAHSLKGNSNFMGYTDIGEVVHKIEYYLDEVRSGNINCTTEHFSILLKVIDSLSCAVNAIKDGNYTGLANKDGLIVLINDFLLKPTSDTQEALEPVQQEAEKTEETIEEKTDTCKKDKEKSRFEKKASPVRKSITSEVVRISVEKLNTLMDMVGEIVISESMVANHPDIAGLELPGLEKALMHLHKNVRELQDIATSMRMIPLSGIFKKMLRLVRDLSTKSNKKVELEISGGETEVDRSVIEHISDPLVHILRNAIDHGIELPEEREAAGKPASGKILLEAKQVGGEIWIVIQDDGRGLNREKILEKAIKKGLVSDKNIELSDKEVWKFIFQPGFSTAEKVTDISGRGVGMDVVVRNIEKMRGKVDIESHPGQGTTIFLKIPITTAIVDGMLVKVQDSIFAIPTLDVEESFQVHESQIVEMMDGQEFIHVRKDIYPVVRLHEIFNLSMERKKLTHGIMILVARDEDKICLFADDLLGQQPLVIKPLSEYLIKAGNTRLLSGFSILGKGEICLILDVTNLIKDSRENISAENVNP